MFTGFASENTPAIQVWDFFRTLASISAPRSVSLMDDCAPVQLFRTGASFTNILVFLPTAPIEGKAITIVNQAYGASSQSVYIKSSDVSRNGTTNTLYTLGQGGTLTLVYTKQAITYGAGFGQYESGWIPLNQMSQTAVNYAAVALGGDGNTASGSYSCTVGGAFNLASVAQASVIGGASNTASNTNAFVGGGSNSTASGTHAAVIGGTNNTASGSQAAVVGGDSNTAITTNCFVAGGNANSAQAIGSSVLGGAGNTASGSYSAVIGGGYGTTRSIVGNLVFTASDNPLGAFLSGRVQSAILILARQTTNATATTLTSNSNAAGFTNQVILPNNSAYYVKGSIIANVTGGGNTKSWDFIATIKRGANAAATSIVGAVTLNVQAADAGAATWVVAITADTTNGGLAVTVTGQAATTIRWVAKLESTEVTY
jgi:hypothetical protein